LCPRSPSYLPGRPVRWQAAHRGADGRSSGPQMTAPLSSLSSNSMSFASRITRRTTRRFASSSTQMCQAHLRPTLHDCPHDCPCELPKQGSPRQQQPNRLIEEVLKREGITRKIEDVREADFRLANRLTRPSGSLRFGASSWSVGSIWGKSGPPTSALVQAEVAHRSAKREGGPSPVNSSYGW
jgi:hypothetical protein